MADANAMGAATLAMTTGVNAFYQFLPKLSELRKADPVNNPDLAADVRLGEFAAAGLALGVGLISSSLTGSPLPTVVAAMVGLGLIILYESTLQAHRPFESKTLRIVEAKDA